MTFGRESPLDPWADARRLLALFRTHYDRLRVTFAREAARHRSAVEILAALAAAAAALVLVTADALASIASVVAASLIRFARAWRREFSILMSLEDAWFPGRHDKLVWTFLLVLMPPVGVWTFRAFREDRRPSPKPSGLGDLA